MTRPTTMSCHSHSHSHSHDHDDDSHVPPIPTYTSQSLLSRIATTNLTGFNLANPQPDLAKLFKSNDNKYSVKPVIKSDCDEQLIINIPFNNSSIKLYSIILRTNGDIYCPKNIKLYKNDTTIDFDNIQDKKPTYELVQPHSGVMYNEEDELPEFIEVDDFIEHHLPRHKFTGVHQLTIFIDTIYGNEDQCRLHSIELRGEYIELNKDPVISLYESAANPADHTMVQGLDDTNSFSISQ